MAKKKKRTLDQLLLEDNFQPVNSMMMLPGGLGGGSLSNRLRNFADAPWTMPERPFGSTANPLSADQGGAIAGGAMAGCSAITNPAWRAACVAAVGIGTTFLPNSGGGGGGGGQTLGSGNCPAGYVPDGKGGCRIEGLGSYIPGDVGMPDTGWTPVAGLYGVGVTPLPVQRVHRACPAGFVLGKDGVCYDHLARTQRAHNPGRKPLLTGGDMNALARARALQKTIGKLNTRFGPKKRPSFAPKARKR